MERPALQGATNIDSHRFVLHGPEPLTITNVEGSRQDQRRRGDGIAGFVDDKKCSSFGKTIREAQRTSSDPEASPSRPISLIRATTDSMTRSMVANDECARSLMAAAAAETLASPSPRASAKSNQVQITSPAIMAADARPSTALDSALVVKLKFSRGGRLKLAT